MNSPRASVNTATWAIFMALDFPSRALMKMSVEPSEQGSMNPKSPSPIGSRTKLASSAPLTRVSP